ncbi:TorD/DmsD family molecular chaperone [Campylobacter gastrosuis]|uniref:Molecular chaperone TorD family protein n=1 Tax=Campylobacter gastrosuis TaxID=2974576 RepID=A0ABT7HPX7_9BACT|nr:molecular chaperone TorD family protein [Campylobacter gastrosuis]MDL0088976.1 molecular chaperone TorD family protein [Campylobacter gastrosuis]
MDLSTHTLCIKTLEILAQTFAQIFYKPNENLYELIKSEPVWIYDSQSSDFLTAISLLKQAKNESFDEISSDFTQLFICGEMELNAPLFGSFYYSNYGEAVCEKTAQMAKIYKDENFYEFFSDLEANNLVNELIFLSFLLKNDKLARAKELFFDEIYTYSEQFSSRLKQRANSKFFVAMGYFFSDFLEILKDELKNF